MRLPKMVERFLAAYGTKLVLEMKIATLLLKSCDKRAELSAQFG